MWAGRWPPDGRRTRGWVQRLSAWTARTVLRQGGCAGLTSSDWGRGGDKMTQPGGARDGAIPPPAQCFLWWDPQDVHPGVGGLPGGSFRSKGAVKGAVVKMLGKLGTTLSISQPSPNPLFVVHWPLCIRAGLGLIWSGMWSQASQDPVGLDVCHPSCTSLPSRPLYSASPLPAQMPPPAGSPRGAPLEAFVLFCEDPQLLLCLSLVLGSCSHGSYLGQHLFTCLLVSVGGEVWGWTWSRDHGCWGMDPQHHRRLTGRWWVTHAASSTSVLNKSGEMVLPLWGSVGLTHVVLALARWAPSPKPHVELFLSSTQK